MKKLNKILFGAGITALSFLPMNGKGQNMRYISENDFIKILMEDKEWMSHSDSCYNLMNEIYSIVGLELKYLEEVRNYSLQENLIEKEKYVQNIYLLQQTIPPLEKELLSQTKKLQARGKELKEKLK